MGTDLTVSELSRSIRVQCPLPEGEGTNLLSHCGLILIASAWLMSACEVIGGQSVGVPADVVLVNGKIATMDEDSRTVQAVAVYDGRIIAVGTNEEVQRYTGPSTEEVDLNGKTVLPGLIDTHLHVRGDPYTINLEDVESLSELKQILQDNAARATSGQWIRGAAWSEDKFEEKRRPTRWDLDEAVPNHPVYLTRAGGHSGVANSLALKQAGITRNTKDPEGGGVEHDSKGEPTGLLRERAQAMVTQLIPPLTKEDRKRGYLESLRAVLPLGITSIINAGVAPPEVPLFQEVYEEDGEELPRSVLQIRVNTEGKPDDIVARIRTLPLRTGFGNDRLKIGALKVGIDGGYTGAAAYTLEPYPGRPKYFGELLVPADKLTALVREANALGWQMGFHTIGDGAIKLCVDIYTKVLEENPREDHRLYLNHFTVMPPRETIEKMAKYKILVAQQPVFTYTLAGRYRDNLSGERLQRNNPLRTLLAHKVHLALGNDNLPIGPMLCIYAAVTRVGMDGNVYGPEEKLTVQEAIRGFTRDAAYMSFDENKKGSIETGKLADLVVLSEDVFSIAPEEIKDIQIERTIVGGRVVYDSSRATRRLKTY